MTYRNVGDPLGQVRWGDDGALDRQRFVCPNGCEPHPLGAFTVCSGPHGDDGNAYILTDETGQYTGRFLNGDRIPEDEREELYEHADGGCCAEPQCATCLECADLEVREVPCIADGCEHPRVVGSDYCEPCIRADRP